MRLSGDTRSVILSISSFSCNAINWFMSVFLSVSSRPTGYIYLNKFLLRQNDAYFKNRP